MRARAESPLRRALRRLAARQDGVSNDEVPGATVRQVARVVQHLLEDEVLFRARLTGKNVRYFTTPVAAETWLTAARAESLRPKVAVKTAQTIVDERAAPWPADAPPFFPKDAAGRPAWKFTRGPPSMLGIFRTNTHEETH